MNASIAANRKPTQPQIAGRQATRRRSMRGKRISALIGYGLAAFIPTYLAWLVTFRELTPAVGFATYPLQSAHLIPYRDYFDPVPPLGYFVAQLAGGGNFGLHNFNMLSLLAVPAFGVACYSLARKLLGHPLSLLLAVLTELLLLSLRLEQVGGWNTQFLMLLATGFVLFGHGVLTSMSVRAGRYGVAKIRASSIGSGVLFALAIIEKQTCLLTILLAGTVLLAWLAWEREPRYSQAIWRAARLSVIGALPIAACTLIFLLASRAFGPFISDMLSGGGKNPHFLSIFQDAYHAITEYVSVWFIVVTFAVVALAAFVSDRYPKERRSPKVSAVLDVGFRYITMFGLAFALWKLSGLPTSGFGGQFIALDVGLALVATFLLQRQGLPTWAKQILGLFALVLPIAILDLWMGGTAYEILSRIGPTTKSLVAVVLIVVILSGLAILPKRLQPRLERWFGEGCPTHSRQSITYSELKLLVALSAAFALGSFINVFSSGGGIYIQWFIPQIIVYFALLLMIIRRVGRRLLFGNVFPIWLLLIVLSTASVVAENPYNWFNWSVQPLFSAHTSSHFPNNYGFQLSTDSYEFYERIYRDAQIAARMSGEGRDGTVFSYPNIPAAATVTGLREYDGVKCAVVWFDVCPNSQAAADLRVFKKKPPNVIVWEPIPAAMMKGNEQEFVHGRSALRGWEAWRLHEVAAGRWRQVDEFVSPLSNGWATYVYAVVKR